MIATGNHIDYKIRCALQHSQRESQGVAHTIFITMNVFRYYYNCFLMIFPLVVLGRDSRNSTILGYL